MKNSKKMPGGGHMGKKKVRKNMPKQNMPGGGRMQKMQKGGKLKMVKNKEGKMVPFYAADGKGKMMMGGTMKKDKMMMGGAMKKDKMMRMGGMMDSDKDFMYGGKTQKMMKGGKMNYPGGGKMKKESMYPGGGRMQHD
tara:strand:+ start:1542 stop:1955 length:414 start_codon:yes stop_codon:yes gene_type:complete